MKPLPSKFFSCKRKVNHATREDAIGALMRAKDWQDLTFYMCNICDGFHLANKHKQKVMAYRDRPD